MARDPYEIRKIYEEMESELIASMQRTLARHTAWEMDEGFQWEQWQLTKLRELQAYRRRNAEIIGKASGKAETLVDEVLLGSFAAGEQNVDMIVRAAIDLPDDFKEDVAREVLAGRIFDDLPDAGLEDSFFSVNEKKLEALQESVKGDLRKAEHAALRKMDDVYRQTLYRAEVNMAAGAKTLKQAVDMSTREFLEKGIDSVEYSNGRRINIASYAEMALRTASQRATFMGEGKKRNEWGIYTVVMSAHANCSPMCLPYQGTVMIDDVYSNGTQEVDQKLVPLSVAMENHAFHPNCRHTLSTFFPGISQLPAPIDDEKAVENYEAEQKQRYIERNIRRYKRLLEGSFDEVNQRRYAKKVTEWNERMNNHLAQFPHLRRDKTREQVVV